MPKWWGPYWKQGTWLNRRYVRGFAKIDARFISRISDPGERARSCMQRYGILVRNDPRLDLGWFKKKCKVD